MEISRGHSSLVRLRHHQQEGPDEDESYPSRSAQSRAERGGAGRRGSDGGGGHAGGGGGAARAHRIQPATAARHGVPADAHGGRGLPRGPDAHVRVLASDLRAPVRFHPIVPVPEAIQAGVGRRVLPRGLEALRGFGRALRWLDADRAARSLRRCPDLRRDRTARGELPTRWDGRVNDRNERSPRTLADLADPRPGCPSGEPLERHPWWITIPPPVAANRSGGWISESAATGSRLGRR